MGTLCVPNRLRFWQKGVFLTGFGLLANVPDLPLGGWGHAGYPKSHSIFLSLGLVFIFWFIWWGLSRSLHWRFHWPIVVAATVTWLSHFFLDAFYETDAGVRIFWPFSTASLALPIPWLSHMNASISPLAGPNLKVYALEVITYGPLLILALGCRVYFGRKNG